MNGFGFGFSFAARGAYRLGYRSQRTTPRDRATNRAFKIWRRLGDPDGGIGDPLFKPKWMRWATFEREAKKVYAADETCDMRLFESFARLACGSDRPRA